MNNTLRPLLGLVFSLIAYAANACWYATFSPAEYFTCRIPTISTGSIESMTDLWHRTLLPDVDTDEIAKLIYPDGGYTVEQIRELQVSPLLKKHLTANDNALLEYVCTMRLVNQQRAYMSDPWYYYYAGDPKSAKLNELADTCLNRLHTPLGDRYAVLAARALITLKRYDEMDSLNRTHIFNDKDMEAIFRPNYAGVLYNMGQYDKAAEIYVKAGDMTSLEMCLKKLGLYQNELSTISRLADYESNYNRVVNELSSYIHRLEYLRYASIDCSIDVGNLIETSLARAATPDKFQPIWLYAAAIGYIIDSNNLVKADSLLALINTSDVEPEFAKSIRTLRFITQCQLKPYDENYLSWLASEAKWLIAQSDLDRAKIKPKDEYGYSIMFCRQNHYSKLYFSDMLHKATDVIIAPRMLEHGDTIMLLQLLDIVDYANLSDSEVREDDTHGNASACFAVECGADIVIEAIARGLNPQTSLDHLWLKCGSIRDIDRWNDFAGTTLLAEGRYKEALPYLNKVSAQYASTRNLYYEKRILNPFAVELRANDQCREKSVMMPTPPYYKLWFATKMSQLEDTFNDSDLDPGTRAEAKLKYGVGMANSVYPCWVLTRYGVGQTVFSPFINLSDNTCHRDNRDLAHDFNCGTYDLDIMRLSNSFHSHHLRLGHLRSDGENHIADALQQINNPETMAAYYRSMGYYSTVKRHYANTSVGKEMRTKCDTWDMY